MKEKITNKILKKIEERKEENYKNSKTYENNSQIAYNSTFYSKMDSRLWFGGISQIILSILVSTIINNPSFIFLKSFLTPVTMPLLLIPISITLGEITRIYLTRNDDKILKKLDINNKTPDFIRVANEIYYKVKSTIEKKKLGINDNVIDNLSNYNNSCELNYSKLVSDNKELQSNLVSKYQELEELIKEQVLCQEYNINQSGFQRKSTILKKSLLVSFVISNLLLFSVITTGLSVDSTILNLESIIKNIFINYMGITFVLTPFSYMFFYKQYVNIYSVMNGILRIPPQDEDFKDKVIREELYDRILKQYYGKSKRKLKKYFNQEIKRLTNKIIELQTKIETNNISINILREETLQKLIKERKNNSIKPKKVEDKKVIRFKGKVKQLIPNK